MGDFVPVEDETLSVTSAGGRIPAIDGQLVVGNDDELNSTIDKNVQSQQIQTVRPRSKIETDYDAIESLELVLNSVVKVFCTSTPCNFYLPWQKKRQVVRTSSGFIIKNKWILSNAHAVTNASSIRIRKHGDATKYPSRILYIAHECDLVIMTVDEEKFWNGLEPLTFSYDTPRLQESITVVGFPIGGDNLSVTKGVVSRVVMSLYAHSVQHLLTIQIDAATNPGNSGGPAIQGKHVVGMAFQGQSQAQSIGYIVPVSIIKHVLDDIERHGHYTAFPHMAFYWLPMENLSQREYYKLKEDQHGILVISVEPACCISQVLKKDDVIMSLDGIPIADDGTVYFRRGERLNFKYIEKSKFVGDTITFTIIRDGNELTVSSPLDYNQPIVPLQLHDKHPEYLIYAGIVFTVLSRSYLQEYSSTEWTKKGPTNLVNYALYSHLEELGQQIVIINQILVDDINHGILSSLANSVLETVNETKIKNIKHLALEIDKITNNTNDSKQKYIRFGLEHKQVIVISCERAKQSETRILKQNSIASPRSPHLM
ncbi:unnamed protein product [Didymodactylos carnosus]|uniref:Protease Do-like PDZ domain-containing protein n=1 Tax=Didymodactylos carnosus TaxID=1234261 RepID=A0A814I124_9BILA|nr:unnamed protein product [Didymodactylos carnosus]CAF3789568.1 unnamed protein product [Didymodactylos carnosus]